MKQGIFDIVVNEQIAKDVYRMVLAGDTSAFTRPGQFLNIRLSGSYLRRPISVCDYNETTLTILYKTVGTGTRQMAAMSDGKLDILTGLGNGYDTEKCVGHILLIGGGVGVPPLYHLCKTLVAQGKRVSAILGFNSADEVLYSDEFRNAGAEVYVTTADGSYGMRGFVTDVMQKLSYDYFCTCGPEPMFRAIEKIAQTAGQYSFEERMGCGFGACMGCSCETKYGSRRICRDGPVLLREEIIW